MRNARIALGALAVAGLFPLIASGQGMGHHGAGHCGCPHCGGMAGSGQPGAGSGAQYDPGTVTTLRGTVADVSVVASRGGRMGGVHLSLRSGEAEQQAVLGPSWFLESEGLRLAKGDDIEITGSLVDADGKDLLIAAQVKKGEKSVRLRDEQGIPAWAGGPPR
ncbi:MAG TPA: DNA-binding protein [Vicinamibacteria bacterium]|nr:DNA-binding protein [Vicinamibacteria bacterium]